MDATEDHRHRCEVRAVLRWRATEGGGWVRAWLAGVAKARGQAAADRIADDCAEQWRLGNRGAKAGEWRDGTRGINSEKKSRHERNYGLPGHS